MALATDLRKAVGAYVSGTLNAQQFDQQFATLMFAANDAADKEARDLCRAVEWEFLDRARGLSSDATLRQNLELLATRPHNETVVAERVVVGNVAVPDVPAESDSSSRLLAWGASAGVGQVQVLHEMEHVS